MSGQTFTIGELAQRVAGGNERAIRNLLNDAGADPRLDPYTDNPGETVSRELVIDLFAQRAGDSVGHRLRVLLGETHVLDLAKSKTRKARIQTKAGFIEVETKGDTNPLDAAQQAARIIEDVHSSGAWLVPEDDTPPGQRVGG